MADEEKNEQQSEETPEQQPEAKQDGDGADEATKDVETPAAADAADAAADEGGGGEDVSSDAGGGEDAPSDDAADEAPADDALEGLDWKARRRLERSRRPAEARPQQPPEERAKARAERRAEARRARASYRRKRREKHEGGTGTPEAERTSVARKMRQGTVVSDKADKTITVRIDVARRHPVYEKIVRSSNTLAAHDERNEANEGDLVRIVETRPISRSKRWRLVEVLEKAK